jgi:integrator complex subunit 4
MLLGSCFVNSKPALNLTIASLLSNLTRYPQDRPHIWICLKELGQHHGSLAFSLLPELLNTHPFFSGKEPNIEDPAYIGVLILVFNAACRYPTIVPLFPQHTVRHYPYLRGSLPDLVPHLELKSNCDSVSSSHVTSSVDSTLNLIKHAVQKVGTVSTCGDLNMVQTLLESTTGELKRLSELSRLVQAVADCSSVYLKCQLLLLKAFRPWLWSSVQSSPLTSFSLPTDNYGVQKLLELSYIMQYGYATLTAAEQAAVMEIRVLAHVYQLLSHSHILVSSKPESRQQISCLFDRLQLYEKLCQDNNIEISKPVEPLLFAKESVYSGKGSGSLLQTLQQALEHVAKGFVVQTHHFSPSILRASAEILIPPRDSEKVIEFASSLATSVQVEAVIENVCDTTAVCIQVVFPDGKQQTCRPKPSDFKELSENKHRLRTSLVLSHGTWSDCCKVQVSVALIYSPDLDESVLFNINEQSQLDGRTERTWSSKFSFFQLCDPVEVCIMPKERFY